MERNFVKGLLIGGMIGAAAIKNKEEIMRFCPIFKELKKEMLQDILNRKEMNGCKKHTGQAYSEGRSRKYIQARSHRIVRAGL